MEELVEVEGNSSTNSPSYLFTTQLMQDPRFGAMMQLLGGAGGVGMAPGIGEQVGGGVGGGVGGSGGQVAQLATAPSQMPMGGSGAQQGRPPSAGKPPSLEQKSDMSGNGPRSTVKES